MFASVRGWLAVLGFVLALGAGRAWAAGTQGADGEPRKPLPIVFVHGNGDTAGLWITTIWRFESNGYPADLLHAVDLRHPQARDRDDTPQAGRSSAAEVMQQLADEVAAVRRRTGADKVILVAQSRGGNTVRNFLKNGGGAAVTEAAILCGAVNHGVIVSDDHLVGSEFNGASPFMRDLNSTPGEILPGVRFLTIRSEAGDKYAQPDGAYLGMPGVPTGVGFDGPALKGAENVAIPGLDHRETGYSSKAFAVMYRFITGRDPRTLEIVPQPHPVLDGKVSGFDAGAPTNIGVAGAGVAIYRVDPKTGERQGGPALERTTGPDGRWGPFEADPAASYEFVLSVPDDPVTHIYRSPFPRSSDIVNLRPQPFGKGDEAAGSVVYMTRPRGYFGLGRDTILLDGATPGAIPAGVPSVSTARVAFPPGPQRTVQGAFDGEAIAARTWPAKDNQVSVIELTY